MNYILSNVGCNTTASENIQWHKTRTKNESCTFQYTTKDINKLINTNIKQNITNVCDCRSEW